MDINVRYADPLFRPHAAFKKLDKEVSESQLNDMQHLQLRLSVDDALSKFHSVTLQLQKEDTNLFEMRTLFDDLLADFWASLFRSNFGSLCHYPSFENGIVKSFSGAILDPEEVSALAVFSDAAAA